VGNYDSTVNEINKQKEFLMEASLIIIDNFYNNPDSVRNFALSQDFSVKGNYPGARTKSFWTDDVKRGIEYFMPWAGNITNVYGADQGEGYNGAFQIATAIDRTWIHSDPFNMWAGVCYLTPDAPLSSGTAIYKHKASQEYRDINRNNRHEGYDYTKWDLVDRIGNKFNRLVIYRGDLYHASIDYFGTSLTDGRLFQTFFFDTERVS
jgi:hypothetical protein